MPLGMVLSGLNMPPLRWCGIQNTVIPMLALPVLIWQLRDKFLPLENLSLHERPLLALRRI